MKTLIIAEKPSVAADLAKSIGKIKKTGDFYESEDIIISSAIGHLVELFMPEDMDPKLKRWTLQTLPILPEKFELKVSEKTKTKFQELKKLMNRADVGTVINACDAGREGELIFTYLYELAKCKKPIKRMWMMSMTPQSIREAYENLRSGESMKPLQDAARCRSEADWLIGINGTRALTSRMYGSRVKQVATVGRVQTPTLSLVVEREREIAGFVPKSFWRILGDFKIHTGEYSGVLQKPGWKKGTSEDDKADRLWDEAEANKLLADLSSEAMATVTEEKKRTKQIAGRLYDLTTLQREANSRFGLPAGRTLQIAQSLYERHKVITYPRTDSKALPEDYIPSCTNVLKNLTGELEEHAVAVLKNNWVQPNKRIFNNKEVSDHFAIIPTDEEPKSLSPEEFKIYTMIAKRFVAIFFPPAEFDVTTRMSTIKDHAFKTEGKILVVPGWLAVYGKEGSDESSLPAVTAADGQPPMAKVKGIELRAEQTRPPVRFSEATLLAAMENAGKLLEDEDHAEAMKERGLGTPATRASIIEHLIREKYMDRQDRELIPTMKAEGLISFLTAVHIDALTSPALTGDWEYKLKEMQHGKISRADFMKGIVSLTKSIVDATKAFKEEETEQIPLPHVLSPTDGLPMAETLRTYRSQDGLVQIYKIIGNRKLSHDELIEILEKRKIGPLDGFKSKLGKPYSAILQLGEDWKVKFVFDNTGGAGGDDLTTIDWAQFPILGICPKCANPVHELTNSYVCEKFGPESCKFRISRTLLGKTLGSDQIIKLLSEKKTALIEGFRSNRTKRLFSAFLILKENGDIGFEFLPRPAAGAKKTPTKKATAKKKTTPEFAGE
jgi:DNA topoisomerase III